jgi:N-acetylmuramic acid 6-phosphate etherase
MAATELVWLMAADSRRATDAVVAAVPAISAAVEAVCDRMEAGGRLMYVGAGTAGRLAVLDAAELGPTFSVPAGRAEAVIAGGDGALRHPAEGAEDDRAAGSAAMASLGVSQTDVVIGVSASGRTPFVLGAIDHARSVGAATVGLACNVGSPLSSVADYPVELAVGGEVIAGSSRLNAGTAQKIALNTISTSVMVLLGKTYGNLMVDVRATNDKLRDRAARIVRAVTGVGPEPALAALVAADWDVKVACLVVSSGKDAGAVTPILESVHGRLRAALGVLAERDGGLAEREAGLAEGDGGPS